MTRRERTLLIAVIAVAALAGANWGSKKVSGWLTLRADRIEQLELEIEKARRRTKRGMLASQVLRTYEQRSLPSEPELANSRYRDWLHHWLVKADINDHQVSFQSAQRIKNKNDVHVYDKYTFSVSCQTELDQWVQLLYEFYRIDHLHRIKTMSVTPLKDGRLSLTFNIEALAIPTAKSDKELEDTPSQRLAYGGLNEYLSRILSRNPYGPANQPPRFASDTTQTAYVGQPVSLEISAKDPEGLAVHYRLIGDLPGEYNLDDTTGELRWTPPKKGEFEVTIVAEDEGFPPKSLETKLTIVVDDAPPEDEAPPFDLAKFTFLTAIVSVDGRPQAWLHSRPEDRLLKLFEGDEFDVGSFHGRIVRITTRSVEIHTAKRTLQVRPGQNLSQPESTRREEVAERGAQ